MPTAPGAGTLLIAAGVILVLAGLAVTTGALRWFGHLPGDLRFERESMRVYVPIGSMLIVSAALSLLLWILRRLR